MGIGRLVADTLLALECWWARAQRRKQRQAERWAKLDKAKVTRGVLGILGR